MNLSMACECYRFSWDYTARPLPMLGWHFHGWVGDDITARSIQFACAFLVRRYFISP